jgi:hypothetical protein
MSFCTGRPRQRVPRGRSRRASGVRATSRQREKMHLKFLLCGRCCQALWRMFVFLAFFGRWVTCPRWIWRLPGAWGPVCLQRPSLRAGSTTRHPMLSASLDESGKACGRRPPLSDGFCMGPAVARAAATRTQAEMRPCPGRCLRPLCVLPPRGTPPVPQTAPGPSAPGAPPPHAPYASSVSPLCPNGPCTRNSGPSPVPSAPTSTPTLGPSRAHGGGQTW